MLSIWKIAARPASHAACACSRPKFFTSSVIFTSVTIVRCALVGGGLTGAAIAWRFAKAGIRVALIERARVGRGSTAASTALLMQEPDVDLRELARRYGKARARRVWQLSRTATRDFVRTIDQ